MVPSTLVGLTRNYTAGSLTGGKTYYFSVTTVDTARTERSHSNEVSKAVQ
jgi:hypothetical protein